MQSLELVIAYLEHLSTQVPLGLFVLIGSFIEEIVAPIPSPLVMTLAGSLASIQARGILYLVLLGLLGATGKIVGTAIFYYISYALEDVLISKFGKFIGVSNADIEKLSEKFSRGTKDFWLIFFARLIPIVPTSPVTIISGILKLEQKTFFLASFFGYFGRGLIYLFLGYFAYESYQDITAGLDNIESIIQIALVAVVAIFIGYLYYKRSKGQNVKFIDKIFNKKK